ncbi:MAG: type II secretion system protein [Patescibacteria group bacterium]
MRGFTLIELTIVLAIMLMLSAIVGSLSSNTLPKSQLHSESSALVQSLRRAQALSIAGKHDTLWGVHLTGTTMTLFAGATYATRDTQHDQVRTFPSGITVSGLTDVVFQALTGETSNTGTITLTADATSETETITVNARGLVEK